MNKLIRKKSLVIFSLLIISILFIAGCQETVGGPTSNTRTSDNHGIRYNLISADNRDTTSVTLGSNYINENCDPPIGTFAYGFLNGVSNTCIRVLGCIQINTQSFSTRDGMTRLGSAQPLLVAPVFGADASKCLSPDILILPSNRPLIDTGLSGF